MVNTDFGIVNTYFGMVNSHFGMVNTHFGQGEHRVVGWVGVVQGGDPGAGDPPPVWC